MWGCGDESPRDEKAWRLDETADGLGLLPFLAPLLEGQTDGQVWVGLKYKDIRY